MRANKKLLAVLMSFMMLMTMIPMLATNVKADDTLPDAIGRHEAEDATDLNGKTPTSGDYYSSCSGSSIVGLKLTWINNTKDYISWTVNAEEAGQYDLVLTYCCPKQAEMMIKVNNGAYEPFTEVADVVGKVAPATGGWNVTGTVSTVITLEQGTNTIYISGPVMDNSTSDGNFFTVFEKKWANGSSANFDCIDISKHVEEKDQVTIDGTAVDIVDGKVTLGSAAYGYYCDGKMYKPETTVGATNGMAFTSVDELSVAMANGAGIRYQGTAGIRFQATVSSDNMEAVNSDAIKEGTLITANDIYEAHDSKLDLTSGYTLINIENSGWYKTEGTYCGSICNIIESNYIRNFTARAYVTVNYEDGTSITVYSSMGPVRTISGVAAAVKNAGYVGIADEYHSVIDSFIR